MGMRLGVDLSWPWPVTSLWQRSTPSSIFLKPGWGIVPAAGGVQRLPRRLPYAVAMEMMLTGRRMGAPEAAQHGLVNRVVPSCQATRDEPGNGRANCREGSTFNHGNQAGSARSGRSERRRRLSAWSGAELFPSTRRSSPQRMQKRVPVLLPRSENPISKGDRSPLRMRSDRRMEAAPTIRQGHRVSAGVSGIGRQDSEWLVGETPQHPKVPLIKRQNRVGAQPARQDNQRRIGQTNAQVPVLLDNHPR